MSLKVAIMKLIVSSKRKKQIKEINKRIDVLPEKFMVPRENNDDIETYLYRPGNKDNVPIIINIHGGAWVMGDALALHSQSKMLSEKLGALVVSLNYIKADKKAFPYCQDEGRDVIEYFMSHASLFNADPNQVCVMGYSAGGNITASAVASAIKDGYKVSVQIPCYPFLDFTYDGGNEPEIDDLRGATAGARGVFFKNINEDDERVSPTLSKDLASLPYTIVVVGGNDPLRVQGVKYYNRLIAAGVKAELLDYAGAEHGFLETTWPENLDPTDEKQREISKKCLNDIIERLKELWT